MVGLTHITTLLALSALNRAVPFSSKVHKNTALVLIDIQNDFITGSLNNSRAPAILPKVYQLLDDHEWPFIVASQDWHPSDHVSFAVNHPGKKSGETVDIQFLDTPVKVETQSLTAPHCVPGTWGAELEAGLKSRLNDLEGFRTPVNYIKKAQDHSVDSYSAFADNQYHQFTTMDSELRIHRVDTIVVTGLITNACVRGTCIDGIKLGYEVVLLEDATETLSDQIKEEALEELRGWGVQIVSLAQWEEQNPAVPVTKVRREL